MRQTLIILMLILSCYQANARGKYDNTDTLIVARDGSRAFRTISEAVEVCRAFMEYKKVIYVKNGIYKEKLIIPSWLTNIEIIGQTVTRPLSPTMTMPISPILLLASPWARFARTL